MENVINYQPKYETIDKKYESAKDILGELDELREPKKGFLKGHLADSPCN
jgi:hypothetical protein